MNNIRLLKKNLNQHHEFFSTHRFLSYNRSISGEYKVASFQTLEASTKAGVEMMRLIRTHESRLFELESRINRVTQGEVEKTPFE